MKRTRPITEVIIESLTLNSFSIECTSILLTQQTTSETKIQYSGAGSISKGDTEEFTIKLYSTIPEPLRTLPVKFSGEITEPYIKGEIIKPSEYFTMQALAHTGENWTAENIWLTGDVNYNTYSMILTGSAESITHTKKTKRDRHMLDMTCLHQGFRFPCNSWTEDNLGRFRNKSEFEIGTTKCTLTILEENLSIQLLSDTSFPDNYDQVFLNALQIATGKQLKLVHKLDTTPDEAVVTLSAVLSSSSFSSLYSPLPYLVSPWGLPTHCDLITKLIPKLLAEDTPHFLQYFMDMFTAYKSGIEASALGFSVAVEGMASHYFKKFGKPDPTFVEKCLDAIPIIHKAQSEGLIEDNVRDKLIANLNGAGAPSVKNILYKLFEKTVTDQWIDIRHPAAHGTLLDKDLSTQQLISCTHTCLYMYYAMLLAHIDFKGQMKNFSLPDYPTTDNEVLTNIEAINLAS